MQPDYTYAVRFTKSSITARTAQIKAQLKQAVLMNDKGAPGCVVYTPNQPLRLMKLADDLATLAITASQPTGRLRKADLVASNLGYLKSLAAASRGSFRLCGKMVQLVADMVPDLGENSSAGGSVAAGYGI
jgi:hypothetical protein